MFSLKKIELKKIKNLIRTLAQRPLFTFLALFVFALILGSLIYYQEDVLAQKKISEKKIELIEIDEKRYEEILKIWEIKEKKFQEVDFKKYLDPFRIDGKENLK